MICVNVMDVPLNDMNAFKISQVKNRFNMTKDYVVVTTISSHRMRYVIHKDDLRELNHLVEPSDDELVDWAMDSVTMEECEDFSQEWIGEQIVDAGLRTEEEMIEIFDRDNPYLADWTYDHKVEWVRKSLKS